MSVGELVLLSVALGTDLFSVAIPIGMNRIRWWYVVRAAIVFALFHICMILAGYYAGHGLGHFLEYVTAAHVSIPYGLIENWAALLGATVLAGLGLHMVWENLRHTVGERGVVKHHPLEGVSLLLLAVSVSVDALAAGFSMGMLDVDLVLLSIILGLVIFGIAMAGLSLGRRLVVYVGGRSELYGGGVLILLGVHLFCTALGGGSIFFR